MTRLLLLFCFVLTSCATPPGIYKFNRSWSMPTTFDATWDATIEIFAENNWPITTLEKDSGLIVSDWVRDERSSGCADCGKPGLQSVLLRQVRFNVFVRDDPSGPSLTVNTAFREQRRFGDQLPYFVDCNSTGRLEKALHDSITQRASQR